MARKSFCLGSKLGDSDKYLDRCVYEQQDQHGPHFTGNIDGRELLAVIQNPTPSALC